MLTVGDDWEEKIAEAISHSYFFIPILTPDFFQSPWCCREITLFQKRQAEINRGGLIFPLLFFPIDRVDAGDRSHVHDNRIWEYLATLQRFDLTPYRHSNPRSGVRIRRIVDGLAETIVDALSRPIMTESHTLLTAERADDITLLATDRFNDGWPDIRPWAGPIRPSRMLIGTPIGIPGGPVSALTLILKRDDGRHLALTAGHCLRESGATVGSPVYQAPITGDASSEVQLGVIQAISTLPNAPFPKPDSLFHTTSDFALIRLDPLDVAMQGRASQVGARSISPDIFSALPRVGLNVLKLPAKTSEIQGIVTGVNMSVQMQDSGGRLVSGNGLVEISFNDGLSPGDSGSLICVDNDGSLRPFAMLIGASRSATAQGGKARTLAYAVPLMSIPGIGDMEIA